jgi:hypothetical protein
VIPGKTGFLYQSGSMQDFIDQLLFINSAMLSEMRSLGKTGEPIDHPLRWIRHAARIQVIQNFNRSTNLRNFADVFLSRVAAREQGVPDENLVLQQI